MSPSWPQPVTATSTMSRPHGYVDGNTNPVSTPDNDVGPGWGWSALLLPQLEQTNLYAQINFNLPIGTGVNATPSQQSLAVFHCPSDPDQRPCVLYNWNTY